jgi:chromosomal replication initiation ATPase DnaA
MIAAHMEPKGLERDATPLADWGAFGSIRADAVSGSVKLRNAILKMTRPKPARKRRPRAETRPSSLEARKIAKEKCLRIRCEVAEYFGRPVADMIAKRGPANLCLQRQIAMYLARHCTTASYADIGHWFGGRDHTTVIHGCDQVAAALEYDTRVQRDVGYLRGRFAA